MRAFLSEKGRAPLPFLHEGCVRARVFAQEWMGSASLASCMRGAYSVGEIHISMEVRNKRTVERVPRTNLRIDDLTVTLLTEMSFLLIGCLHASNL